MSQRAYKKRILAYSGTMQYAQTEFLEDNNVGDSNYIPNVINHPTCIDLNSTINKIKIVNFTESLQDCVITKVSIYNKNSGLLIYDFNPYLTYGQEIEYDIQQNEYFVRVTLDNAVGVGLVSHGDIIFKNVTDNIVLFTNGVEEVASKVYKFDPFNSLINKNYEIKVLS